MFSVIMPAYNVETYVAEAIESILNQTRGDWELIVVNDGSRDSTPDIINAYAAVDERIHVVNHETNLGLAAAYNSGLYNARYPWVAVLDSDDIAFPDRLELQAMAIAQMPHVIAWGGFGRVIDEEDRQLSYTADAGPTSEEEYETMRRKRQPIFVRHSTLTFRRDIGIELGGYHSDTIVPDYDFMDRLSDRGVILAIPQSLCYYRMHRDNTTMSRFFHAAFDSRYIWERRRRQTANQPMLTYDEFVTYHQHKSGLQRLRDHLQDRGRYYFNMAGMALGSHHYPGFVAYLALSVVCSPLFTLRKLWRRLTRQPAYMA